MLTTIAIILIVLGIIGVVMAGTWATVGWILIIIGVIVGIVKLVQGKKSGDMTMPK